MSTVAPLGQSSQQELIRQQFVETFQEGLPNELLQKIFSFLQPKEESVVAQVCKRWQANIVVYTGTKEYKHIINLTSYLLEGCSTLPKECIQKLSLEKIKNTHPFLDCEKLCQVKQKRCELYQEILTVLTGFEGDFRKKMLLEASLGFAFLGKVSWAKQAALCQKEPRDQKESLELAAYALICELEKVEEGGCLLEENNLGSHVYEEVAFALGLSGRYLAAHRVLNLPALSSQRIELCYLIARGLMDSRHPERALSFISVLEETFYKDCILENLGEFLLKEGKIELAILSVSKISAPKQQTCIEGFALKLARRKQSSAALRFIQLLHEDALRDNARSKIAVLTILSMGFLEVKVYVDAICDARIKLATMRSLKKLLELRG